jgi:hypothetical protein
MNKNSNYVNRSLKVNVESEVDFHYHIGQQKGVKLVIDLDGWSTSLLVFFCFDDLILVLCDVSIRI